ncbi:hypothetical protein V5E38_06825 [Rossellomorea sp. GAMAL-10_SWC]
MMKRAIGIFLSFSAILTYLKIDALYDPLEDTIISNGVTTVTYDYPTKYWAIFVILIITFILGIYFIFSKEKQPEECPLYSTSE